jgi:hypothetical protein
MNSATVTAADEQEAAAFLWALDRDSFAELCGAFARHRETERARIREAIAGPEAWLDSWAQHVGNCQGGYVCTCGLTLARTELSAALAQVSP